MDKRKELILNTIIKEHIKTGVPVGSGILVEKYKLDISPATVRNEMMALEEEGFIMQPHTSAGRIPTEKAYDLYLTNLKNKKCNQAETKDLEDALRNKEEGSFKEAAKMIANISGNAVFWAFHRHNLFYTGISNLFQQPEFSQINLIYDISAIIDRIDEIVDGVFPKIEVGRQILIGSNNPFGNIFGTVLLKYKLNGNVGLVGIVGPIRMDYEKNIAIVDFIGEQLARN
jgi:transcriptional regulator of heat shock response